MFQTLYFSDLTTSAIIMNINDPIAQLKFYKGPFQLKLNPGASETLIKMVEHAYGTSLPDDFKTLYRFSNGFEIDEDILNMIPLEEMIRNKERNKPIWIAEYMIYCDMWELNIHPDNSNDYSISYNDWTAGKTILTNSLTEFLGRMLKGGVFEKVDFIIGVMK